ncbi:hypothetical protein JO972_02430 [Verrucomicrobiaceae bacterium 5K15]|nr:hypothetical protein [Oceaniferula flavus]
MWGSTWLPIMQQYKTNPPTCQTPEDAHWDWKMKASEWRKYLAFSSFSLICDGELQGLLLINNSKFAKLNEQFGKPLVYIEFVATAPWNRPELQSPPKYRGTGSIFILAAIEASKHLGFKGRIGLHSLSQAANFYEHKCGMTQLGKDPNHQNLTYFEMTEQQAEQFCHNRL